MCSGWKWGTPVPGPITAQAVSDPRSMPWAPHLCGLWVTENRASNGLTPWEEFCYILTSYRLLPQACRSPLTHNSHCSRHHRCKILNYTHKQLRSPKLYHSIVLLEEFSFISSELKAKLYHGCVGTGSEHRMWMARHCLRVWVPTRV